MNNIQRLLKMKHQEVEVLGNVFTVHCLHGMYILFVNVSTPEYVGTFRRNQIPALLRETMEKNNEEC